MDREKLGGKFWLVVVAVCVGIGIAGFVVMAVIGWLWYAWGFFGTVLVLCAAALAYGWYSDRRAQRERDSLAA